MSVRGSSTGRGRGRPRGSKNKPGSKPYQYTIYKPGPEVYEELFRPRNEPPVITRALPDTCPIPFAQSSIIDRRQIEGFTRYYYNVRITYDRDESKDAHEASEPREEIAQVEMSQILKYVSRRELERYEQEDYAQQARAEEIARRAEAEELAKRRLQKNFREPGISKGIALLENLELGSAEVPRRPRGRPRGSGRGRGRGRGRPRGSGLGRGDVATTTDDGTDPEEVYQGLTEQELLGSAMLETSDDDEAEEVALSKPSSPSFARSSFVANSALPLSPVALHRRLSKTLIPPHLLPARVSPVDERLAFDDEEEEQRDARSISSGTAQSELEHSIRGQQFFDMDGDGEESEGSENTDDMDQHRTKRQRTESTSSTPAPASSRPGLLHLWAKQPATHTRSSSSTDPLNPTESGNSDDETDGHAANAQLRSEIEETPDLAASNDNHYEENGDVDMMDDEEEYVVESIISHSYENGKKYYLVKWEGYDDKSDWLPEDDLSGARELVTKYNERLFRQKGKEAVR